MLKKLLQDFETLEKYYSDNEYRRRLVSSSLAPGGYYYSPSYFSEYFQLEHIYDQDSDVMEKLNLTENCTIRYEKEAIITI